VVSGSFGVRTAGASHHQATVKKLMNLGRVSEKKIGSGWKPGRPDENRDAATFEHMEGILVGLVVSQVNGQEIQGGEHL